MILVSYLLNFAFLVFSALPKSHPPLQQSTRDMLFPDVDGIHDAHEGPGETSTAKHYTKGAETPRVHLDMCRCLVGDRGVERPSEFRESLRS